MDPPSVTPPPYTCTHESCRPRRTHQRVSSRRPFHGNTDATPRCAQRHPARPRTLRRCRSRDRAATQDHFANPGTRHRCIGATIQPPRHESVGACRRSGRHTPTQDRPGHRHVATLRYLRPRNRRPHPRPTRSRHGRHVRHENPIHHAKDAGEKQDHLRALALLALTTGWGQLTIELPGGQVMHTGPPRRDRAAA